MIIDLIERARLYADPRLAAGFAFLADPGLASLADGRHDLPDGAYAMIATYETAPAVSKQFEAHRRYIDIQYLVEGEELIQMVPTEMVGIAAEYDPARDLLFLTDPPDESTLLLRGGMFAVFYPDDAHRPGIMTDYAPSQVRKVVVKVPVGERE